MSVPTQLHSSSELHSVCRCPAFASAHWMQLSGRERSHSKVERSASQLGGSGTASTLSRCDPVVGDLNRPRRILLCATNQAHGKPHGLNLSSATYLCALLNEVWRQAPLPDVFYSFPVSRPCLTGKSADRCVVLLLRTSQIRVRGGVGTNAMGLVPRFSCV